MASLPGMFSNPVYSVRPDKTALGTVLPWPRTQDQLSPSSTRTVVPWTQLFSQGKSVRVLHEHVFLFTVAKLSPSANPSWAEVALVPIGPATHPPAGKVKTSLRN